jgi:hypothetical protein
MKTTPNELGEIKRDIFLLTRYYVLWWFFVEKSNAQLYGKVEIGYPEFFSTVVDSLRESFFNAAYRLFDGRPDVVSLEAFLQKLEATNSSVGTESRKEIKLIQETISKIRCLRGNVIGHRNKTCSPESWFTRKKLKPKEMQSVVRLAQSIFVAISGAPMPEAEQEFKNLEQSVRSDAHSLMEVLVKADE